MFYKILIQIAIAIVEEAARQTVRALAARARAKN